MQLLVVRGEMLTGSLTRAENQALAAIRGDRRREEWKLGRLAAHQLIDRDVLVDPDGAPRVDGAHISISHDGPWFAVAVADTPIGVDVCVRTNAERSASVLRWLGVDATNVDPCAQWAALEAVLKLRRLPVEQLRDRTLALRAEGDTVIVHGLGDDVRVRITVEPDYVVAVCG